MVGNIVDCFEFSSLNSHCLHYTHNEVTDFEPIHRPEEGTDCSNSGIPCSKASVRNQIKYFTDFYCDIHLGKPSLQYFWFDGLDSSWRRQQDVSKDSVEGHFGFLDDDGTIKDHFRSLSFQCPKVKDVIFKFPRMN